jgi:hypothetical protein
VLQLAEYLAEMATHADLFFNLDPFHGDFSLG